MQLPAGKSARVQERRRIINRVTRSSSRTAVKKAERMVQQGETEAVSAVTSAVSALDRAARKGIVHPNNAARRKSRLVRKLNASLSKT